MEIPSCTHRRRNRGVVISRSVASGIFRKSRGEKSDSGWTLYGDNGRRVEERKDVCKKGINDSAC